MGGLMVNIVLGAPYLAIIQRVIARGYAASQTEVIRQALQAYEQKLWGKEEERRLVHKAVQAEMAQWRASGHRGYTLREVEAELAQRLRRESSSRRKHTKT